MENLDKPIPTLLQIEEQFNVSSKYLGALSSAQHYKVAARSYKSTWDQLSMSQALAGLQDELKELQEALQEGHSYQDVLYEAADCANYLAIIAGIYKVSKQAVKSYHIPDLEKFQAPKRDKPGDILPVLVDFVTDAFEKTASNLFHKYIHHKMINRPK